MKRNSRRGARARPPPGGSGSPRSGSAGARPAPERAPRAPRRPPEPRRLLTFPRPPKRVWPAPRAAPGRGGGPGPGAGCGGVGLGGSGRVRARGLGTGPGGGAGAVGSPRARGPGRPSRRRCAVWGAEQGRRGPSRGAGGALLEPAGRSSLQGRPGAGREAPRPGSRRRGARIRGAVLSPQLTNQSGPRRAGGLPRPRGARGARRPRAAS